MSGSYANMRTPSMPYGVDIDLTHGAFRLSTIYEKDDGKWVNNERSMNRIFRQPYAAEDGSLGAGTRRSGDDEGSNNNPDEERHLARGSYEPIRQAIIGSAMEKYLSGIKSKLINFSDVVDLDDEAFEDRISTEYVGRFVESAYFKIFMTSIIVLNALMIALETDENIALNSGSALKIIDTVFLMLFAMEILMKWYEDFFAFWKSGWNVFDVIIVASALLAPAITFISSGRVLRVLRILRAFRALRGAAALEGLRTVASTIVQSIPDMVNIIMLLLLIMFIFSVLGVTLFKSSSPEYFGDLSQTMFTLFVLITQDGWVTIFEDMEDKGLFSAAAPYFAAFIILGALIFVSLIVAVVVANLGDSYAKLERSRRARYRKLKGQKDQSVPVNRAVQLLGDVKEEVWEKQIAYEVPEKLNNYFAILTLQEQNLVEYAKMKAQLNEIVTEVRELNKGINDEQDDEPIGEDDDEDLTGISDNDDFGAGDPLSQMLRR